VAIFSVARPRAVAQPDSCTDSVALARRIEAAEAQSAVYAAEGRREWLPGICIAAEWFGSTCAVFAGHWTHLTQAIATRNGLAADDLSRITRFFHQYAALPTVQACELFRLECLPRSGYRLIGSSDVLVASRNQPLPQVPGAVVRLSRSDTGAVAEWITVVSEGCLGRELQDASELEIGGIVSRMKGTRLYLAMAGHTPASGGALFLHDRIGILFCDSTLPAWRGNGFQRDLIGARLQAAWDAGCEFAAATVERGSSSAKNYMRCGFRHLYSRLTFQLPRE
jgi:GNAT superfamily N-acetyltransferase